jgi:hypothetical protein
VPDPQKRCFLTFFDVFWGRAMLFEDHFTKS